MRGPVDLIALRLVAELAAESGGWVDRAAVTDDLVGLGRTPESVFAALDELARLELIDSRLSGPPVAELAPGVVSLRRHVELSVTRAGHNVLGLSGLGWTCDEPDG